MAYSIWQDVYYETTGNSIQFLIQHNDITLYRGKAYAIPSTNRIRINLSNICENYLDSNLPDLNTTATTVNTEIYKDFVLVLYDETTDTSTSAGTYTYLMNYDREYEVGSTSNLNVPVNGHYATGMIIPTSNYQTTTLSVYSGESGCDQYAIIYLNARGGWDSFLFEGKCTKSDNYTISKYKKTVNNNTTGFGSTRYMNIIKPTYVLNTGWLTEDESELFAKHIVGSNKVYLQDLVKGDIIPVLITDNSVEYKEFDRSNPQPISYTLTVEASQDYRRK